jgi:hypothetical protein
VWTWGSGARGQLGHNDRADAFVPRELVPGRVTGKAVFVAAGGAHTIVVTGAGKLWAFGCNAFGQLGLGRSGGAGDRPRDRLVPTPVGEGEEALESVVFRLVACGDAHSVAVAQDGGLWSWGRGHRGRLGHGDEHDKLVPTRVAPECFGGAQVVTAACGAAHTAAATARGELFTWGAGPGLGHGEGDDKDRWAPARVPLPPPLLAPSPSPPRPLLRARVGHFLEHPLEPALALAFAMGTHWRLGPLALRTLLPELVQQVLAACARRSCLPGVAGAAPAVLRLLGSGVASCGGGGERLQEEEEERGS